MEKPKTDNDRIIDWLEQYRNNTDPETPDYDDKFLKAFIAHLEFGGYNGKTIKVWFNCLPI